MDLIRNFSILTLVACGLQTVAADRVLSAEVVRPLVRVIDLNVGESTTLELCDGQSVEVTLLELNETRDPIRQAVRSAMVTVLVDGQKITLESGMYNLPQPVAGVQIDCSITKGYNSNGTPTFRGLDKDASVCSAVATTV